MAGQKSPLTLRLTLVALGCISLPWVTHNFDLRGRRSSRAGLVAMTTRCMVSHLPHGLHGCSTSLQTCNHRAIFGCVVVSPHLRRDKMVQLVHFFLNKNIQTQTIHVVFSNSLDYCSTSWLGSSVLLLFSAWRE